MANIELKFEVEADDEKDALDKVESDYYNEEIVLSADDFTGKEFKILED